MPTRVSLIIPTYNRGEILADTIKMAAAQDYADYEVIVVDQDPVVPDVVERAISETNGRARLLRLIKPSLTAARNAGVRAAEGEIIIFIDDDVVLGPEYITAHARNFDAPSVGGVMGLTLPPGQCQEGDEIESALRRFNAGSVSRQNKAQVSWILGPNTSYRKNAIIQAGLSDERFTGSAWSEDADLSVRVRHLGYELLFDPTIRLIHLELSTGGCENRSTDSDRKNKIGERCRLFLFFSLKNRSIFGVRGVADLLWGAYRQYAFNRSLLKSLRALAERQVLFASSLIGAIRMLRLDANS